MNALSELFVAIRAVRDTEGVHALLLDCHLLAVERGEAEGVSHAKMLLRAITEYERQFAALAVFGKWPRAEETECASS